MITLLAHMYTETGGSRKGRKGDPESWMGSKS